MSPYLYHMIVQTQHRLYAIFKSTKVHDDAPWILFVYDSYDIFSFHIYYLHFHTHSFFFPFWLYSGNWFNIGYLNSSILTKVHHVFCVFDAWSTLHVNTVRSSYLSSCFTLSTFFHILFFHVCFFWGFLAPMVFPPASHLHPILFYFQPSV